jgi:succinoglycan biosynthesis transport protein ExoP
VTAAGHAGHAATLRDYLHVLHRRKWILLQAVVLVPAAAVAFSLHQQKLYQASAQVLLSTQNLAAQLTGTQQVGVQVQPDRIAQTQADVARVPVVAARALRRAPGSGLTPQGLLADSSVSTSANSDILTFKVVNHHPALARRLVNAYAFAYTRYRRHLDTTAIRTALLNVDGRINRLAAAGGKHSALYSSLVDRQQTLATMSALQTSNATVVQDADKTALTQPKTTRNGILGLFLGIVLGIGLAFLWEALDTRVRTAPEISERLGGLPMLGRLPMPRRQFRTNNRLVMLGDPSAVEAESFRMLRTSLDFATLGRDVRTIMITSAVEREGKSTTIANLAVALARAGQRVVLVDLDLRRPYLDRFFNLEGPGVTQVALGHASLENALTVGTVAITDRDAQSAKGRVRFTNGNGNGAKPVRGVLAVLPSGPIPPDPGEFVGTAALGEILEDLRERADMVLVDAPPVLQVGDAMTLSAKVDGILLVTKMKTVRRHMLIDLGRQLAGSPTPVLGFVVTGAEEEQGYGYGGYAYGYGSYGYGSYTPREKPERTRSEV